MKYFPRTALAALALLSLTACWAPAHAATANLIKDGIPTPLTVTDAQGAISQTPAGATIVLPAGLPCGDLLIRKPHLQVMASGPVTCRSITVMKPADGVSLRFLNVHYTPDAKTVSTSGAVRFVDVADAGVFDLTIDADPSIVGVDPGSDPTAPRPGDNVKGWPTATGIRLERVTGAFIGGTEISGTFQGIGLVASSSVTIEGGDIHDVRTSPIAGGVLHDLIIRGARLRDSKPWNFGATGDHGDAIHIWTNPNTSQVGPPPRVMNVTITGNTIVQRNPLLGIYLDDNSNGIGFGNVDVSDNICLCSHAEAVLIENGQGQATGNVLLQLSGDPAHNAPSIRLVAGSKISLSGNFAHDLYKTLATQAPKTNTIVPTSAALTSALLALAPQ